MTPRVLLVDDDPDELELLVAAISPLGADCERAEDGEAAVRLVAERAFAAAVLDLLMPRLNGFETAARIRRLPNGRSLPLIVLSGYDPDAARSLPGWREAADEVDYVCKPFSAEELKLKLARSVGAAEGAAGGR